MDFAQLIRDAESADIEWERSTEVTERRNVYSEFAKEHHVFLLYMRLQRDGDEQPTRFVSVVTNHDDAAVVMCNHIDDTYIYAVLYGPDGEVMTENS